MIEAIQSNLADFLRGSGFENLVFLQSYFFYYFKSISSTTLGIQEFLSGLQERIQGGKTALEVIN